MSEEKLPNNLTKGDQLEMVITHFQAGVYTTTDPRDIRPEPTSEEIEEYITSNSGIFTLLTPGDIEALKTQIPADYRTNAPKPDSE